jgi:PKD repeat protein
MQYINDVEVYAERTYYAEISYTPDDDPINGQLNGANPCWLGLHLEDGNVFRFHRAFNYNKPHEWDWMVDCSSIAKVNFEAEAYDPGMDDITFTWDFGDGSPLVSHDYPSTGTVPTRFMDSVMHIYVLPTTYTVTLHAYDDDGGHDTFSCALSNSLSEIEVDNMAPRAEAESNITLAVEDERFDFNGLGTDVLGDVLSYQWDFDDGDTETGDTVNHSYADEGVYLVTLTVNDSFGTSSKDTLFVIVTNEDPIAEAGYDHIGYEDDVVEFDGYDSWDTDSDFDILEFAWDYGDGSKGEGPFPSHVYTTIGFYLVTLTVTDNNGATSTDTLNVTVMNPAPYDVEIEAEQDVDEDAILFFTGSASDTPSDEPGLTYLWNFGDGTTGNGRNPTHSYSHPGAFPVTLTVTDDDGDSEHLNATILVENVLPEAFAGPTNVKLYGPAVTLDFTGLGFDTISDDASLECSWLLGGGTVEYTPDVSKTFSATGIYDIRFKVEDTHLGKSETIVIRIDFAMDSDGDCLTDETESAEGTESTMWDSDTDNLIDDWEVYTYPTDPTEPDTDNDLLNDWEEITFLGLTDPDGDGLVNPVDWDSDGEWIKDGIDPNPLQYNDVDGTPLTIDAINADHYVGYGVSVAMYGGASNQKPWIFTAAPSTPLPSGIGIYANIVTTDSPPFQAQIRMRYDESLLPSGMSEDRLCMFYWDNTLKDWVITEDTGVDTTYNFVWAKVTHFTVFGIGDIASLDSDGDGLNNWAEMISEHTARFFNYKWFTTSRYNMGQSLYVKNSRAQYKVPSSQIKKDGTQAAGTVDLFSIGFTKADFAIADSWKLTNGGSKVYITVYTIGFKGTRSASVEFSLNTYVVGTHVMSLYVKAPTNPRDADTDDDGKWDGYEVNTYRTSPIDPDTDNDGYDDGTDLNPLIDLKLSVRLKEILQFDKVDSGSKGDFYFKIFINNYWYNPSWKSKNNAHVYPNFAVTTNIPDNKQNIPVKIELWDSDSNPDDRLDIASGGDIMDVTFNVKTGMWSGEDSLGDRSGFGHTSGHDDGSTDSDQDDCDVWFDIYTNDNDGDRLTFWQEVYDLGTDPTAMNWDTDSDKMPDWWELRFGLRRTANDANGDLDGDRLNNLGEYNWGTDPKLFEFNVKVSCDWDADSKYLSLLAKGMKKASDFLFDVTDGYMYFRTVIIYDNKYGWNSADVHVLDDWKNLRWNAYPGGYFKTGASYDIEAGRRHKIRGPHDPDERGYYATMIHEWGHYAFYLGDEYIDYNGDESKGKCSCIMDSQYSKSEFCYPGNHKTDTRQEYKNHESCWETIFKKYKDKVFFDLNKDGVKDTTFLSSFKPTKGPGVQITGAYTKVEY